MNGCFERARTWAAAWNAAAVGRRADSMATDEVGHYVGRDASGEYAVAGPGALCYAPLTGSGVVLRLFMEDGREYAVASTGDGTAEYHIVDPGELTP